MALIKLKRGPSTNVTSITLEAGEPAYTTDTKKLYIGNPDGTKSLINPDPVPVESVDKLTTARNFSITGDGTASAVAFDGTQNVPLALTLSATGVTAGTYTKLTVDAKGRVTSGSSLSSSDLPPVAITDTFPVASQAEMLALTAQKGDVAVRTDQNKSYILKNEGASTLANWQELLTPTDSVLTVNGQTGAVVLSASDVGAEPAVTAGSATQYWDGAKTWKDFATSVRAAVLTGLSTATSTAVTATDTILAAIGKLQAQITLRAPLASPALTGTPTAPTATASTNNTQIATTAFVKAQGYLSADAVIDGGTF